MPDLTGHCLCGACRFTLSGPSNWVGHCHCESCRRATASPVTTWIGHPNGAWRWDAGQPARFSATTGRERGFCPTCGTPLFYRTDELPDETHFYAALLDHPERVEPTRQFHANERIGWVARMHRLPHG